METSAKANINVENVRSHPSLSYNMLNRCITNVITCIFVCVTGIFDTCQRHQIKNGHKIGEMNSLIIQFSISHCEKIICVMSKFLAARKYFIV